MRRFSLSLALVILAVPVVAYALNVTTMSGIQFQINDSGGYANEASLRTSTGSFSDAYDGMYRLSVNGTTYTSRGTSTTSPTGSYTYPPQVIGSLSVQRHSYFPTGVVGNYLRLVDTVTNTGTTAAMATIRIYGNLGSDSSTSVTGSSSGDTVVSSVDSWFGTDDSDGTGDPSLVHLMQGLTPTVRTSAASISRDSPEWTFTVSVPAGERVAVMSFAIVHQNRAMAAAEAARILTLPEDAIVGLDPFEADIVNFALAPEGAPRITFTSPATALEGESFAISVAVEDPEMDPVTYSWDLDGDEVFDEMPGVASITVPADTTDGPGVVRYGVRATDGMNTYERYRTVTIENVTPMITSTAPRTTSVGAAYEYAMAVTEPAGMLDPLLFEVATGPESLTVDEMGVVRWMPNELDVTLPGEAHRVVVLVNDGDEGIAMEEWEIMVDPNRPPRSPRPLFPIEMRPLDSSPELTAQNASDPDFDTLSYHFELDIADTFDSPSLVSSGPLEGGIGFTKWQTPDDLMEGTIYHWRVWASDGVAESPRTAATFRMVATPAPAEGGEDAGAADGGGSDADGGISGDAAPGPIGPPTTDDGGCAVAPTGTRSRAPWALVVIGVVALTWIRRRRR